MSVQSGLLVERGLVEALSERRGEPRWLTERRLEALRQFEETPLPNWDRTDLGAVGLESLLREAAAFLERVPPGAEAISAEARRLEALDLPADVRRAAASARPGSAVLVNVAGADGRQVVVQRVDPALAARGLVVTALGHAASAYEATVRAHLMTRAVRPEQGKFPALSGALWDVGTLVYVPPGVQVDEPVEIVTWAEGGRPVVFPRTLVVLGQEARLRLVETWGSSAASRPVLVAGAVEIVAGPAARLDYASIQRWDAAVSAFVNRRAVLEQDSQVEWALGEFGSGLSRAESETSLEGRGASSHSVLVFFGSSAQHLDLLNVMDHTGTHTDSDIVARGVLSGRARGVYRAVSHIHSGARESGSWQKGNVLVLSADARADANPSVTVEESEVRRAGHAATVGKVDAEQLFYLMSRGLREKDAIRLIVEGFLQPVLEKIPIDAVRHHIMELVGARLMEA